MTFKAEANGWGSLVFLLLLAALIFVLGMKFGTRMQTDHVCQKMGGTEWDSEKERCVEVIKRVVEVGRKEKP